MNDWSRARKRIILAIVLFFVIVLIGIPFYFLFYQTPTCSDGAKNGDETGVDCGGSCQRLCTAESLPLVLQGDPRVLEIAPNVYEVVAIIENPNATADVYRALYTFKLYDASSNIEVKVIEGSTYIPKGSTFAIFEGPFTVEPGVVPRRAVLEWDRSSIVWRKNTEYEPELVVRDKKLSKEDTSPRLDAVVENNSLERVSNIDFITFISDENGNIFAASKTFVDDLLPGESMPIIFSWPRPFAKKAGNINIITRIFPDRSFIK